MTQENSYQKKQTSQTSNSGTSKSTLPTSTSGEGESDPETEGESHRHYVSEPTRWTYPNGEYEGLVFKKETLVGCFRPFKDSEIDDPIYIRDNESQSDFEPLPRVDSDYRLAVDTRIEEHFIGIKTSDEAAALVKADDFALYYRKDKNNDVGAAIQLHLVHRNTIDEVFHFPVLRCCEENGSKWWYVQIGNNKMQSFRQLSDLVRCYHLYRFTDARSGRMEVFPLWQGGIVDDYV